MRFTSRDVLWLMVAVGLSLGWFVHAQSLHATLREWEAAYHEAGHEVRGMWYALHELGPTDAQKDQFIKDKDHYAEGERRSYEERGPPR